MPLKHSAHTAKLYMWVRTFISAAKSVGLFEVKGVEHSHLFVLLVGCNPTTKEIVNVKCVKEQTEQALKNVKAIIEAAGGSLKDIVNCMVCVTNIEDCQHVNEVFAKHFPHNPSDKSHPAPAHTCFAVKELPKVSCDSDVAFRISFVRFVSQHALVQVSATGCIGLPN